VLEKRKEHVFHLGRPLFRRKVKGVGLDCSRRREEILGHEAH
jgi:hypothetical protein